MYTHREGLNITTCAQQMEGVGLWPATLVGRVQMQGVSRGELLRGEQSKPSQHVRGMSSEGRVKQTKFKFLSCKLDLKQLKRFRVD